MASTRSSTLREDRWHLVEGDFLSWDLFGPLLRKQSATLSILSRFEV